MAERLLKVYKSERMQYSYLYVDAFKDLTSVPEALLQGFGEPAFVMSLKLSPERKLALANAGDVLAAVEEQGFYLQMPPPADHAIREALRD